MSSTSGRRSCDGSSCGISWCGHGLKYNGNKELNPAVTWHDLEWLQSLSPLPLVIKGILGGDDAARAVEYGAKAIVVSNHGGRQLDGAIAI
jgi:isopentenyl diphosphate isomerase/L-lactate dehydrogenase-like FMN-dependent dehydrogenase